ncbi:MAG: hypothetical protein ABI741_14645 [Ferruginibacter sp.]
MKKILLAIVMLSTVSFFGCNSGGGDPKVVLGQFFTALSKSDIEGARKLATKDSKSMIDMMEMGMKMGKDKSESEKFKPDNMEIGEAKIDGDKAVVPVKEKTTGETLNYNLKKEDGGWKVAFDKASVMSMGMEKMNEKGINPADSINAAMDKLKDINMDSLKEGMKKGMEAMDTLKKAMKDQ